MENNKKLFFLKGDFKLNPNSVIQGHGLLRRDLNLEKQTQYLLKNILNNSSLEEYFQSIEKQFQNKKNHLILQHLTRKISLTNMRLQQEMFKKFSLESYDIEKITPVEVIPVNLYSLRPLLTNPYQANVRHLFNFKPKFETKNTLLAFTDIKENESLHTVLPCVEKNFDSKTLDKYRTGIFEHAERNFYLFSMLYPLASQVGPWKIFANKKEELNDLDPSDASLLAELCTFALIIKEFSGVQNFSQTLIFDTLFNLGRRSFISTNYSTNSFANEESRKNDPNKDLISKELISYLWNKLVQFEVIHFKNNKLSYNDNKTLPCFINLLEEIQNIYFQFLHHNTESVSLRNRKRLSSFVFSWKEKNISRKNEMLPLSLNLNEIFNNCREIPLTVSFTPTFAFPTLSETEIVSYA